MRTLFAVLLILHGVAHSVGFVVPWKLIASPDVRYRTTVLGGVLDVGDVGIRATGVVWLMLAIAFVTLGGLLLTSRWSQPMALAVVIASLAFCVVGWPDSKIGLAVNLVILGVIVFTPELVVLGE